MFVGALEFAIFESLMLMLHGTSFYVTQNFIFIKEIMFDFCVLHLCYLNSSGSVRYVYVPDSSMS